MYKLFRDIHLALGLFSAVFLLAYGLSAVQMAYPIYRAKWKNSTETFVVPDGVDVAPRPLARWLMDNRGLRGDLETVQSTSTAVSLTIMRPATRHDVKLDRATRRAEVTTGVMNVVGMLNRLHHAGGLWHDYWAINVWGWFLALVSVFLIIVALTGVYMWFKRHRERRVGTIVFVAGLAWGISLLFLVRMV